MTQIHHPRRVAIVGTITNAATGEILPQAVIRITAAPRAFTERILALLTATIVHHPELQTHCNDLIESWDHALAPLVSTQRLFDRLGHGLSRPDQVSSGGDGLYCFFDLPPGQYQLTAAYTVSDRCHGTTSVQAEVAPSTNCLTFVELDIALSLVPGSWPATVADDRTEPSRDLLDGDLPARVGAEVYS